jgi:hypothetical protein
MYLPIPEESEEYCLKEELHKYSARYEPPDHVKYRSPRSSPPKIEKYVSQNNSQIVYEQSPE